ncbi:hypothetical protein GF406_06540 [candidate division KSB1 bacterium]|nr:hypothetical protein [candidate division KSB1 bacterium]
MPIIVPPIIYFKRMSKQQEVISLSKRMCIMGILLFMVSARTQTTMFKVDTTRNNLVQFHANLTIGDFTATTSNIEGQVRWEEPDTLATSEVNFRVDLASFDTGIGLRNTHMREKYLETDQYPYAEYSGSLTEVTVISDSVLEMATSGIIKIHGVEQEFQTTVKAERWPASFHVTDSFELNISDYQIKQPRFLFTSMDRVVRVKLSFYVSRTSNVIH